MKRILLIAIIFSVIFLVNVQAESYKTAYTCIDDPLFSACIESYVFSNLVTNNLTITSVLDCNGNQVLATDSNGLVYCDTDDVGGGAGASLWVDGGTFLYPNTSYADNVRVYGWIEAEDWTNVTITESQISDLQDYQDDIGADCSAGDFVYGVQDNGVLDCDTPSYTVDTDTQKNASEPWLYNDTTTIYFNESMLSTIYYNATEYENVSGTIDGGTIVETQHRDGGYDGVTFNFSEVAGSPGLDLRINFTEIEDFNAGVMRYRTSNLFGDFAIIQLWNYDDSIWEDYPAVPESDSFATIEQPVFDSSHHIQNNVTQMRIYKSSNGNINNHYYIDWIAISRGFGTPAGEEVDPIYREEIGNYYNKTETDSIFVNTTGDTMTGHLIMDNNAVIKLENGAPSNPSLTFESDTNVGLYRTGSDQLGFVAGGVLFFRIVESTDDTFAVNDFGNDIDFRIESDDIANILYIDGQNWIEINGNITIAENLTLTDFLSCTALETDASGNLVCGTDTYNTTEEMQDAIGASFDATFNYTDALDLMGINRTWGDAQWLDDTDTYNTTEEMQDACGAMATSGDGVDLTYSDAGDTLTTSFDCSDVTDSASDHLSCSSEDIVVDDDFVLNTGDTIAGEVNITSGNLNISDGNVSISDTNFHCLSSDCSKYMTYNGTALIIQG